MSRIDETIQAKLEKRQQLEKLGVMVHPHSFAKTHTIAQCLTKPKTQVQTAGRVLSYRTHGKVVFMNVVDPTGQIQIMVRQQEVDENVFQIVKLVDHSDFIGVTGKVTQTKTGETTIQATDLVFLGKALRPLPTQWNAAENKEVRFRKRYVDMLVNSEAQRVLNARWIILKEIRRYLQDQHNFVEVETPVMQPLYGGTNAKPFTTHMNALDTDFYLRLAPELYLKRLIVGGYERIFEIARNFRNEGIDQTHQPEFTMIEWYEAYVDYHRMMEVAEGLIQHLVQVLYSSTKIQVGEHQIDVGGKWPKVTMVESLRQYANIEFDALTDDQLIDLLTKHSINLIGTFTRGKALFALFDNLVTDKLINPTWIIDYPRDVSPLAKKHPIDPNLAERFEGYIGGKELADGWSEIVDPIDQRQIFENEQQRMRAGDDEAHPLDEDFIESMEYGMPPLGGIGIGIDRLVMFLTNTWSIREVIAFPTLRPVGQSETANLVVKKTTKPKQEKIAEPSKHKLPDDTNHLALPTREQSLALLEKHVPSEALRHHCQMVAQALEAYAKALGEDSELWYQTGLLHDSDYEEYPDEHPLRALDDWLKAYPVALRQAVAAHYQVKTGQAPESLLDKYLVACDEISGFMHAVSLVRPGGFDGMTPKSVKKKLKNPAFAAKVSRTDVEQGLELIGKSADEHFSFLIEVFQSQAT